MWFCGQCGTQNDEHEPVCVYCGYENAGIKTPFGDRLLAFLSQKRTPDIYKPFETAKRGGAVKLIYHAVQAGVVAVYVVLLFLQNGSGLIDEIAYRFETRTAIAADSVTAAAQRTLSKNVAQAGGYKQKMLTALDKSLETARRAENEWNYDIADNVDYIVNGRVSGLPERAEDAIESIRRLFE
jgi:hypothetical protein